LPDSEQAIGERSGGAVRCQGILWCVAHGARRTMRRRSTSPGCGRCSRAAALSGRTVAVLEGAPPLRRRHVVELAGCSPSAAARAGLRLRRHRDPPRRVRRGRNAGLRIEDAVVLPSVARPGGVQGRGSFGRVQHGRRPRRHPGRRAGDDRPGGRPPASGNAVATAGSRASSTRAPRRCAR